MCGEAEPNDADGESKARRNEPRRWRWLRRLIVVLLLLGAIVAAAPFLLSTDTAVGLITAQVNGRIHGRVEIDGLSLAWFSPCRVSGLRITDRQDREVVRVERLTTAGGLWRLATRGADFGRIDVVSPQVVLYRMPDGRFSLAEAVTSREAGEPDEDDDDGEDGDVPPLRGQVVVTGGSVRVVEPDGRRFELSEIGSQVELETLSAVKGKASVALPGGGTVDVEATVLDLVSHGRLTPERLTARLSVETGEWIELEPIGRFALKDKGLRGRASLDARLKLSGGRPEGSFDVRLDRLAAGRADSAISARLQGKSWVENESVEGQVGAAGPWGAVQGRFHYRPDSKPRGLSADKLISALMAGEGISLPDFTLDANGQIDLPQLARAIPSLLNVRPDVSITAGTVRIERLALRGGSEPHARGAVSLERLVALRGEQTIRWQPVSARFDMGIIPKQGLRVRDTRLRTEFATLDANGTPADLNVEYKADLAKLRSQLGEVFNLGDLSLAGKAAGSLNLAVRDDRHAGFRFGASVDSLKYAQGGRKLQARVAALSGEGSIERADKGGAVTVATTYSLAADDELAVKGSASGDLSRGAFRADATVERGVLAGLARKAKGLGAELGVDVAGELTGSVSLRRDSAAGPLVSSGGLTIHNLLLDGNSVGSQPVRAGWTDVSFAPQARKLAVKEASLTGDPASVVVKGLSAGLGKDLLLDGSVDLSADLARCAAVAAHLRREKGPLEIAGKLTWSGTAGRDPNGSVAVTGSGGVAGLVVGSGKSAVRVEPLAFNQAVRIDAARQTLHLEDFRLVSDLLDLRAAGTVRRYSTEQLLAISGHYKGDWERLMAVAHRLLPDTKEVALTGPVESDFLLAGPASSPKLRPTFRNMKAQAGVGWDSAKYAGFSLGQASLAARLVDGRIEVLPVTAVDAAGGKIRLGGLVDLAPNTPLLSLPGETVVLENVPVNREVAEQVLSRFNPIFGQLVSAEGRVTMSVRDLSLPLGQEIKKSGSAAGRLDLSGMKVQPGGLLAALLDLGGITPEKARGMEFGGVDFLVRDGAIHYDDFTVTFDGTFDLKFRGAVRFDDELDLAVSVPVRSALLRRLGVRGRVDQYARLLEGARVEFPIMGTRLAPKPDLAQVDVRPLVKKAMEALLRTEAGSLLDGLLKPRGGEGPASRPAPPVPPDGPATKPAPKKPEEQALDGVFDLLNDLLKPKKRDKQ